MTSLLVDGGFTTQLTSHISDKVDGHPLWGTQFLLTNEEVVINTHRDFVRAGADVITTNTYQSSINGFQAYLGLTRQESYNLIKNSVYLAKEAINIEKKLQTIDENKQVLVAGSIGPFGASLRDGSEYRGDYIDTLDLHNIEEWHRLKIKALVEGGVDIIAFETIPALGEAEILINLLKEFPNQKAWLSFSSKDSVHIAHGEKFDEAAIHCWSLNPAQLIAIGVNCMAPSIATTLICSLKHTGIPLIVYPNNGGQWDEVDKVWIGKDECAPISSYVETWLDLGVRYIGGCCQITASDIAQFRTIINSWNKKTKKCYDTLQ